MHLGPLRPAFLTFEPSKGCPGLRMTASVMPLHSDILESERRERAGSSGLQERPLAVLRRRLHQRQM